MQGSTRFLTRCACACGQVTAVERTRRRGLERRIEEAEARLTEADGKLAAAAAAASKVASPIPTQMQCCAEESCSLSMHGARACKALLQWWRSPLVLKQLAQHFEHQLKLNEAPSCIRFSIHVVPQGASATSDTPSSEWVDVAGPAPAVLPSDGAATPQLHTPGAPVPAA